MVRPWRKVRNKKRENYKRRRERERTCSLLGEKITRDKTSTIDKTRERERTCSLGRENYNRQDKYTR